MKKLLAILLCAMLLIGSAALAESSELKIGNLVIDQGGQTIDLSGIDLKLAFASDDERGGARLAFDVQDKTVLEAVVRVVADKLVLSIDGVSDDYAIGLEDLAEAMNLKTQGGNANLVGTLKRFNEEDFAALTAVLQQLSTTLTGALGAPTTETIDDEEFNVCEFNIDEAQADACIAAVATFLDRYPELLEGSDASSFKELIDQQGLKFSVSGKICSNATHTLVYLYPCVSGEGSTENDPEAELYFIIANTDDASLNVHTAELYVSVSDYDAGNYVPLFEAYGAAATSLETGEFVSFDFEGGRISEEDSGTGVSFSLSAPSLNVNNQWVAYLADMAGTFEMVLSWGDDAAGGKLANLEVLAEGMHMTGEIKSANGAGSAKLGLTQNDQQLLDLGFDFALTAGDSSWLSAEVGETIDMMKMTEAQSATFQSEFSTALMGAMSAAAAANEDLMALLSGM